MLTVRRILCPVDFSDASRHAFDHAVALADWYSSSVAALHISTPVAWAGLQEGRVVIGINDTAPRRR
jgi:nucleotide-binding universal stress UspA family protein